MGGLVDLQAGWSGAFVAGVGRAGPVSHRCLPSVLPASTGMQYHKLTEHFDEKPFSCKECGAKFAANSTLKNHLRLHTGDRPFMCKHCLMTFMQASALAYHTKKKHAEGEPSPWDPAMGSACSIRALVPCCSICLWVASPSFGQPWTAGCSQISFTCMILLAVPHSTFSLSPSLYHPNSYPVCSSLRGSSSSFLVFLLSSSSLFLYSCNASSSLWLTFFLLSLPLAEFHTVLRTSASPAPTLSPMHYWCLGMPLPAHGQRRCIAVFVINTLGCLSHCCSSVMHLGNFEHEALSDMV